MAVMMAIVVMMVMAVGVKGGKVAPRLTACTSRGLLFSSHDRTRQRERKTRAASRDAFVRAFSSLAARSYVEGEGESEGDGEGEGEGEEKGEGGASPPCHAL